MAQDILKQTERVTRIVESLVNFSHAGSEAGDTRLAPAIWPIASMRPSTC